MDGASKRKRVIRSNIPVKIRNNDNIEFFHKLNGIKPDFKAILITEHLYVFEPKRVVSHLVLHNGLIETKKSADLGAVKIVYPF